ncbi:Oligopeptide transporter 5 [Vanrija pseudolonga]|uniref:Oligopeptide transporter 5 n=1 Tax=Vanrija pseudolonga TaxID=143232 RepID=A0AAF0YDA0_9TREE|nr:Oligopeptide transporter 5 [Vanrija pseudolonga]
MGIKNRPEQGPRTEASMKQRRPVLLEAKLCPTGTPHHLASTRLANLMPVSTWYRAAGAGSELAPFGAGTRTDQMGDLEPDTARGVAELTYDEKAKTHDDYLGAQVLDAGDHGDKAIEKRADSDAASDTPPPQIGPDGEPIIVTGADAANYLLSLRDDHDPSLTFRSLFIGTLVSAFQAAMNQIYNFKPSAGGITGSFIVLIIWFLGRLYAFVLPRGDTLEAKFRDKHGADARRPWWLWLAIFLNSGEYGLKEHAVAAIMASSASNGASSVSVFTVQNLFYDQKLTANTVILTTLSIGLFGYGLTGILRPITVWHPEAVYWGNIPLVKTLQALHWDKFKSSKPLRYFWYAFGSMTVYEFFPAYIFPWLNSISVPCLASMNATGSRASILTNLFGGSLSNEGLGILNFSFDWQYITSGATSLPLKWQANFIAGYIVCWIAFLAVYYGNAWGARDLPFLSSSLRTQSGKRYSSLKVFKNGVLDKAALAEYGLPRITATYAFASTVGTMAIGGLIAHCVLFWGPDIVRSVKNLRKGKSDDRHHAAMVRDYPEAPWWWYIGVLLFAFILGIVAVVTKNLGIPVWAYIVALLLGAAIAPFSTLLYSRFGNGIATNQVMKMVAGLTIPGRPIGNLYFSAWSHTVIANSLNLASDLKMGEYLKIPPQVMFLTQIWGTVFGAFINYVVMISVVNAHRDLLVDTNGSAQWSGQAFQSMNNQATTWALAKYMYSLQGKYYIVPFGLLIGFGFVVLHRVFVIFVPRIGGISTREINLPTFFMYTGWLGYNQTQSCTVLSGVAAGFYVQYYLRNYRPRIFKDFQYLVTAGFDGASLFVVFILSFAVLGAGGPTVPFPTWWGNPNTDTTFIDHCPQPS